TGNLSEDESTSGTYRVAEKTASQGGYLALRLPLFSKYDELILVGSHETYLKQYGLDIFSTSTQVRRDIDFHTKYHSGVIYRFLFLSLGYSGGREKLDMYISQNGVELFREEYDFFSHTRMASISLAAGGNSTIMLSWMRKDSPKAVGKELDLLTFSRDIKYVQLDLGPLGLHYEHHLESHQLGSISETTYELRRYGLGVDLGDGFRFGISHEQRDKKEESTLPIFDSYSKKSTRVQFEWYY
ncbi:MAG: hypothetical protein OEZ59_10050, partial [Deltaproteobacteria bacterium]|nr:hypothetical protein [Deltaproteobacteria bacterium]